MSVVLRPDLRAGKAARITQTAAVGVAKALWGFGVEARIKWPNDLLVDGRKICGILAESSAGKAPAGRPDLDLPPADRTARRLAERRPSGCGLSRRVSAGRAARG